MPKPHARIVALFLVPYLIADSGLTSIAPLGAGLVPARNGGQTHGSPLQFPFASQALALVPSASIDPLANTARNAVTQGAEAVRPVLPQGSDAETSQPVSGPVVPYKNPFDWMTRAPWEEVIAVLGSRADVGKFLWDIRKLGNATSADEFARRLGIVTGFSTFLIEWLSSALIQVNIISRKACPAISDKEIETARQLMMIKGSMTAGLIDVSAFARSMSINQHEAARVLHELEWLGYLQRRVWGLRLSPHGEWLIHYVYHLTSSGSDYIDWTPPTPPQPKPARRRASRGIKRHQATNRMEKKLRVFPEWKAFVDLDVRFKVPPICVDEFLRDSERHHAEAFIPYLYAWLKRNRSAGTSLFHGDGGGLKPEYRLGVVQADKWQFLEPESPMENLAVGVVLIRLPPDDQGITPAERNQAKRERAIRDGDKFQQLGKVVDDDPRWVVSQLSVLQQQVLSFALQGMKNSDIADRIGMTVRTVSQVMHSIYDRLLHPSDLPVKKLPSAA